MDEQFSNSAAIPGAALPVPTAPVGVNFNGILPMIGQKALSEMARRQAEQSNSRPVIQNLASHVKKCFTAAEQAKQEVEQRMLQSLRQRRGEYDPADLADIKQQGGTEIYMMLTSNKVRAAASWLKDTLLGQRDEKPWTLSPTPKPELPPDAMQSVQEEAAATAMRMEQEMGGAALFDQAKMNDLMASIKDRSMATIKEQARISTERCELKMEDQLVEGGFQTALAEFVDDICTYPSALLKGPVVRNKPRLTWVQAPDGSYKPEVKNALIPEWERVDPFMAYPSPDSSDVNDGYFIERHRLKRSALTALKGVEGYNEGAIDAVLAEYGHGGLREWLSVDTEKSRVEGKSASQTATNPDGLIDALQFWGEIQGKLLREWGMEEKEIPDELKDYNVEVWVIGGWVIKATLNFDPFGNKPYYRASYEEIPGAFWGNSVPDLIRDCARVCNAAARALVNNMGLASGPQVGVNVDRLPEGADLTQMFPWKVWQFTSDPYGASSAPIEFFQPGSLSNELMTVYDRFATLADEYSSIPRYMTGDSGTGGAGRTASGMSMLMSNAGKAIKQVVNNIDVGVLTPLIERQYYYNMLYSEDAELKRGDLTVVARGANSVLVKEQAQVRRNEFLSIVLGNPMVSNIVGPEAIADLLRETAKTLDMNVDKLIPPPEVIRYKMWQQQQEQLAMQQAMMNQPLESMQIERDETGAVKNMKVMPGNRQQLQNGAPVTDNFAPQKGA